MGFKIIKKKLSMEEAMDFVNGVVEKAFYENEDGSVTFSPFSEKVAIKLAFARYYTDYQFPENVDEAYDDLACIDIHEEYVIPGKIDYVQFTDIEDSIRDGIRHLRSIALDIHNASIQSSVVDALTERLMAEARVLDAQNRVLLLQEEQQKRNKAIEELLSPEETVDLMRKMSDLDYDPKKISEMLGEKFFTSAEHSGNLSELFDHLKESVNTLKKENEELKAESSQG